MASEAVINIAELVAPLRGDNPAGADLREDFNSVFYELKTNRSEARTLEERQTAQPDWAGIVTLASKVLSTRSKDIDVFAWLIEGLLRTHRFAGLRDGISATRQAMDAFWDTMFPGFDPEDKPQRVKTFQAMAGNGGASLLPALRLTPLVEGTTSIAPGSADRPASISMFVHGQATAMGGASQAAVDATVSAAGEKHLKARYDEVQQCIKEVAEFEKVLTQKCEASDISPISWTPIARVLEEISDTYVALSNGKISTALPDAPAEGAQAGEAAQEQVISNNAAPRINATGQMTRKQAFEQIRLVARYFEQTEPQSIIGPALLRVVAWGEMPLGELLKAFVPDSDHRRMFTWLGIEPKSEPESF